MISTENKNRLVFLTNCSRKFIKNVKDDQEYINQFTYKYNIRLFKDGKVVLKSVRTHLKAVPYDFYFDENNVLQRVKNDSFTKYYGYRGTEHKIEGYEKVNKLLELGEKENSTSAFGLLRMFIFNKFQKSMTLEQLTENELIIYSHGYAYGQVNYLKDNDAIPKAYSYDINSEHPYIMKHKDFLVPVRQGKAQLINDIKDIDLKKVGLYMVNIEFNEKTKFFKPIEEKRFYTVSNYFLEILNKTETKYTMYRNNALDFNAMVYELDDCINIESHIGYNIRRLFEEKNKGCQVSSKMLKLLLGMFSKKSSKKELADTREERKIYNSSNIIRPNLFFRFQNFVHDMCRVNLYKYIEYCQENDIIIYRIKADAIHVSKKIKDEFIDDKSIGFMKYEGKYKLMEGFKNVNDGTYKTLLKKRE